MHEGTDELNAVTMEVPLYLASLDHRPRADHGAGGRRFQSGTPLSGTAVNVRQFIEGKGREATRGSASPMRSVECGTSGRHRTMVRWLRNGSDEGRTDGANPHRHGATAVRLDTRSGGRRACAAAGR